MAGGGFSGLTSQTSCPLSCGSDRISIRNPARPYTSDRCVALKTTIQLDNLSTKPIFKGIDEYLTYKNGVMQFIKARNKRIENYTHQESFNKHQISI